VAAGWDIALLALAAAWRVAAATPAAGGGAVAVTVEVDGPSRCGDAEVFFRALRARMEGVRRAGAGEEGVRLSVHLTRTASNKVRGELRVVSERAQQGDTRTVDGATCSEVIEVLSLTAALALDRAVRAAAPVASQAAAAPASAPSAAPSGGVAGTGPSPAATGAGPASPGRPAAGSGPPPSPPPPVSVAPAPPPPSTPPPPAEPPSDPPAAAALPAVTAPVPPARPVRAWRPAVGATIAGADVVGPYVNVGGGIFFRLGARDSAGVGPSVSAAILHLPNDFLRSEPEISVRWTAAAITGCPGWGIGERLRGEACGQVIAGWLAAEGQTVSNPQSAGRSWLSLGALVRGTAMVGGGFALELDAGVTLPLMQRRFIVTMPDRTVGETGMLSVLVGLAVARAF
jgi:hypothetical protein